jgi:hypothetical protein
MFIIFLKDKIGRDFLVAPNNNDNRIPFFLKNEVGGNFEWLPPQICYPMRLKTTIKWDFFSSYLKKNVKWDVLFGPPPQKKLFP